MAELVNKPGVEPGESPVGALVRCKINRNHTDVDNPSIEHLSSPLKGDRSSRYDNNFYDVVGYQKVRAFDAVGYDKRMVSHVKIMMGGGEAEHETIARLKCSIPKYI